MANDLYIALAQPARCSIAMPKAGDAGGGHNSPIDVGTVTETVETTDSDRAAALLGRLGI